MNRVEAKSIIDAGKNVLKLLVSQGGSSNTPLAWLANWENIKAFSDGAEIRVRGSIQEFPRFINEVEAYEVVRLRELDWRKVLGNGGYGLEVMPEDLEFTTFNLVGFSLCGMLIVQKHSHAPLDVVRHLIKIKDPSLIQESWYAEEDMS